MSVRHKLAAAMPFAHLLGIHAEDDESRRGKRARRAEEEDDDRDDDKDARRAEEEDDREDEDRDGKKGKRARRAEEDEGDEDGDEEGRRAEEEDDDEGEEEDGDDKKDSKKSRRAKSRKAEDADDEDDDDSEMRGSGSKAQARRRERARCAAIFGCAAAATHPHVAANLAFNTAMPRSQAIAVLQSIASSEPPRAATMPGRASLTERMAGAPVPKVGADGGANAPAGMSKTAAAIVAAAEKAQRR